MAVNSVNASGAQRSQQLSGLRQESRNAENKQSDESKVRRQEDKIELSTEAIELSKTRNTSGLQQIQTQINAGFYSRPDVLRQTAAKISESLPREIKKI